MGRATWLKASGLLISVWLHPDQSEQSRIGYTRQWTYETGDGARMRSSLMRRELFWATESNQHYVPGTRRIASPGGSAFAVE